MRTRSRSLAHNLIRTPSRTGAMWVRWSLWKANLDLASVVPELDMYDRNWPIRTYNESLPPAKFVQDRSGSHGMTLNSLVSGGCVISGSVVVQSVLFSRVRVNSFWH